MCSEFPNKFWLELRAQTRNRIAYEIEMLNFFIEIKMNKNTDKHMDCLLSEHEETFYFNQSL